MSIYNRPSSIVVLSKGIDRNINKKLTPSCILPDSGTIKPYNSVDLLGITGCDLYCLTAL